MQDSAGGAQQILAAVGDDLEFSPVGSRRVKRALVLGGGGVAGIAWELGVLLGLAEAGVEVAGEADLLVGTSAGAVVAAQVGSGILLRQLVERQSAHDHGEIDAPGATAILPPAGSPTLSEPAREQVWREIGEAAVAAGTVGESTRRAVIEARLPSRVWPDRSLLITAVSINGAFTVFDKDSGVSLVDAVAASCALPGVWPPVTIGDQRYLDGGVRSGTNADLARGCGAALVITPAFPGVADGVDDELAAAGIERAFVVRADEATVAAFGDNWLSPATRPAAAAAGRQVGARVADRVHGLWRR